MSIITINTLSPFRTLQCPKVIIKESSIKCRYASKCVKTTSLIRKQILLKTDFIMFKRNHKDSPLILLLGIYPEDTSNDTKIHTHQYYSLHTCNCKITQKPKCPYTAKWLDKLCYIYTKKVVYLLKKRGKLSVNRHRVITRAYY